MQPIGYIIGAVLVAGIFAVFMTSLLDMISLPLVNLGITTQRYFKVRRLEEKNAWLFTLLISVTRIPIILLASASFFFYLLSTLTPNDGIILAYQLLFNTSWIILVMRFGSIFFGSVLFGEPIRDIMKSLRG